MDMEYLERESDAPVNWQTNVVMKRGASGEVETIEVPDDPEEVEGDA